jgi:predicted nucleic acid-binding protein
MKPIFVDSSAWIAMNSKRDVFYSKAVSINKELLQKGHHYVTTNFVPDETYTALMMKIGHFASVDFEKNPKFSSCSSHPYNS